MHFVDPNMRITMKGLHLEEEKFVFLNSQSPFGDLVFFFAFTALT